MATNAQTRSLTLLIVVPESDRWTAASITPSLYQRHSEVEMSIAELSDHQLLAEAKAALREKDGKRAKAFFVIFSERSLARNKARVANDPA